MKLTKRLFTLLLAILMASACFVGCSGDDNHNDDDDDKNSTSAEIKDDDQNGKDEIIKDDTTANDTTAEDTTAAPDIILPHEHTYENGACTVCGEAEPKPSEGLEYTLNYDGESYSLSGRGTCKDAHIVIPATHDGKPVTTIAKEAFTTSSRGEYHGDKLLTGVTIPDSVTRIDEKAFYNCTSLTSISIPDSVTLIGMSVFSGCDLLNYNEYKNGKYLGNSNNPYLFLCEVIDRTASSFDIHGDTKIIIWGVFSHCTSLTSINIPDGVTHINLYAFNDCTSLTNITIPGSVTSIDVVTFRGCSSLTNINIPEGVTSIGAEAFCDCSSLTSITIPDSVTYIGFSAFSSCVSLTSINYGGTIEQWNAVDKYIDWGIYNNSWDANTGDYTIHCTDGDIAK